MGIQRCCCLLPPSSCRENWNLKQWRCVFANSSCSCSCSSRCHSRSRSLRSNHLTQVPYFWIKGNNSSGGSLRAPLASVSTYCPDTRAVPHMSMCFLDRLFQLQAIHPSYFHHRGLPVATVRINAPQTPLISSGNLSPCLQLQSTCWRSPKISSVLVWGTQFCSWDDNSSRPEASDPPVFTS